ncbi:MAG: RodZ domain-containing protein, partial [Alphaproteobacteria bacterium]
EYLGLDGEKMVQLFKKQSLGSRIHPSLNFPTPASESKIPSMFFALAFLVAGVVVIALWSSFDREERSEVTQVPPVSETRMAAQAPNIPSPQAAPVDSGTQSRQTPQSSQLAAPTEVERRSGDPSVTGLQSAQETQISSVEAENAPSDAQSAAQVEPEDDTDSQSQSAATTQQDQQGIILNVNENSWVEIRDMTGKAIVSRVLKAGDQYFVPDRPDLRMSLGNAVGVEIVVDGKTLPPLGRRGEVKRNIALDSASLKALAQP